MNDVRRLLPFVTPYWKRALVALAFLTLVVFMDLSIPRLIQHIIDDGIKEQNQAVVVHTALIMLVISAASAALAIGNNVFSVQVGEAVGRDLREALFKRIQSFSFSNFDRLQTGQLIVRLSSDTGAFQRLVLVSLRIGTRAPFLMLGSLALMIATNPRLAFALSPVLLVTLAIIVFFIARMAPLFRTVQQKLDRLNTVLQENIAGVRLVKAFVRGAFERRRFGVANEDYTERSIRVMQFMSIMGPVLTTLVNIGLVIVLWAGGIRAIQGEMTIGEIVAFTNYLMTTMSPLILMAMLSGLWAAGIVSAKRLNEVMDMVPAVQDATDARPLPEHIEGHVVFENVSFHYESEGGEGALLGINLEAAPGQTVAILGATGAGKSTLVNLIPRFYDASEGRILIDGIDIRRVTQDSLLMHVAVVPQETVLFTGSIRENISYGRPHAEEHEVIAAAKAAQAHDFIEQLPEGYDTHVEQRGVNLSGGQKQRVAIARALLARPRILILDDSTSAVDSATERGIQHALETEAFHCTRFVVAQRISSVLGADKIVVLEEGRIVAEGTHASLLASSRVYQEIYASQLGEGLTAEMLAAEEQ